MDSKRGPEFASEAYNNYAREWGCSRRFNNGGKVESVLCFPSAAAFPQPSSARLSGGLPFRKNAASSVFADYAKPNVAGTERQQFPCHIRVLGDKEYDFSVGDFEKPIESRVMPLHACVAQVVTRSARKRLQPLRSVKFEGSATTRGAQQAQALATSARRHHRKAKAKPQTK